MPLTNAQFGIIMRGYEARQLKNHQLERSRRDDVYEKIPAYRELDEAIGNLSLARYVQTMKAQDSSPEEYHHTISTITMQKRQLLVKHGFSPSYLDRIYDCPDCEDSGFVRLGTSEEETSTKCHCFYAQEIDLLYQQSNLKETLKKNNFETLSFDFYEGEDLIRFRKAADASRGFADSFSQVYRNLYFYGAVGTGKSFLSECIAEKVMRSGFSVLYFSAVQFFEHLSYQAFDAKDKSESSRFHEDMIACDLLIIDDLGTELINAFVNSRLFSCLNERDLRHKATVISTNLDLKNVQALYSERIFSRISSHFDIYKLTGPDIRMIKKYQANRK
ncbi:MAG: ATP-binding protein [Lachnospiraceae bacterium]|jgi:DNA replication protein DnaC|nr:ATP-binding protein [Lachnospiraceae bacterium]